MMRFTARFGLVLLLAAASAGASGCAQLMGSLRRDLDDSTPYENEPPTVGGRWSERGFLSEDAPETGNRAGSDRDERYMGHSERSIASGSRGGGVSGRTWVSEDDMDARRRDARRGEIPDDELGGPSFASNPDMAPPTKRMYRNGGRATREDFVDNSQNEGSLWASDGQTNYYFTKNKIRGVGDIINVTLEDSTIKDISLEARRTLASSEREYELSAAQERIRAKTLGLPSPDGDEKKDQIGTSAAAPARSPAGEQPKPANPEEIQVRDATYADVDMSKSLAVKAGEQMLGEIVERYPNGNYKVRATKKVPYKGGNPRLVVLTGIVRGTDIGEDDVVSAGKMYEYRVEAIR